MAELDPFSLSSTNGTGYCGSVSLDQEVMFAQGTTKDHPSSSSQVEKKKRNFSRVVAITPTQTTALNPNVS